MEHHQRSTIHRTTAAAVNGSTRKFFVIFTMIVFLLFGALAAVAAVGGLAMLAFAPPLGIGLLLGAAVLAVMSWQVKRTFDSITAEPR